MVEDRRMSRFPCLVGTLPSFPAGLLNLPHPLLVQHTGTTERGVPKGLKPSSSRGRKTLEALSQVMHDLRMIYRI